MRKTRGGWGAATAPFPKSRSSYFRFARFNTSALYYTILYYLRAWQRLGVRMTLSLHCFSRPCLRLTVVNRNVYPGIRLRSGQKKAKNGEKQHKMGVRSEPSGGPKSGKSLWRSTALPHPQNPDRFASPTDMLHIMWRDIMLCLVT